MTMLALSAVGEKVVAGTFSRAMRRAGEALGAMSGQIIEVSTPQMRRCSAADVLALAGGADSIVLAVYLGIHGSLQGHALVVQGGADPAVEGRARADEFAAAAAHCRTDIVVLEGANHYFADHRQPLVDAIGAWTAPSKSAS
jgi:hypothetical protein